MSKKAILILDNLDSFTYNLAHLFGSVFDGKILVKRDYEISFDEVENMSAIILSPGPKRPKDFPMNKKLIEKYYQKKPILGVCLGMQAINEFYNGKTVYAPKPVHGKTSKISHSEKNLFKDIPQNINVARYHSLMCKVDTNFFDIEATTLQNNVIMAIKLKQYPVFGIQYHPESFLTEFGKKLIDNFLYYV